MQHIEGWLSGRNLQKLPAEGEGRLEAEALTYALITYLVRREQLPDEVVIALAEDFFGRIFENDETH